MVESNKVVNMDIRWAKIPYEFALPQEFFEDIKVMFPDLPVENYLDIYTTSGCNSGWAHVGFDGGSVKVFGSEEYEIQEYGYEVPWQYAKDQSNKDGSDEDQEALDEAFELLEKRLKQGKAYDAKGESAISTLAKMGFVYVDGSWTYNSKD